MISEGSPPPSPHEREQTIPLERWAQIATLVAQARLLDEIDKDSIGFGPRDFGDIKSHVLRIIQQQLPHGATMTEAEAALPRIERIITEAGGQANFLEARAQERERRLEERRAEPTEQPPALEQEPSNSTNMQTPLVDYSSSAKLSKRVLGRLFRGK